MVPPSFLAPFVNRSADGTFFSATNFGNSNCSGPSRAYQGPTDSCTENTGYTFSSFSCGHGNASDSASSQAGANTANGAATMEQAVDEMFTAAVAVAAPKAVNAEVCAFSTTGATGDTSSCAMLLPRGSTLHW
jgi:hypothetical protein